MVAIDFSRRPSHGVDREVFSDRDHPHHGRAQRPTISGCVQPDANIGLLHDLLREMPAPYDHQDGGEQLASRGRVQLFEGRLVAFHHTLQELLKLGRIGPLYAAVVH